MKELSSGLWTWKAPHPDWQEGTEWGPDVRSYALEHDGTLLLFDPVSPPDELVQGRPVEIVLTCGWHKRSSGDLGARVYGDGDVLPGPVNAQPGFFPEERTLWLPAHGALIVGDAIWADGDDIHRIPDKWLTDSSLEEYQAKLRPLLDLPLELFLPTHGDPVTEDARDKLRRALT